MRPRIQRVIDTLTLVASYSVLREEKNPSRANFACRIGSSKWTSYFPWMIREWVNMVIHCSSDKAKLCFICSRLCNLHEVLLPIVSLYSQRDYPAVLNFRKKRNMMVSKKLPWQTGIWRRVGCRKTFNEEGLVRFLVKVVNKEDYKRAMQFHTW